MNGVDLLGLIAGAIFWIVALAAFVCALVRNAQSTSNPGYDSQDHSSIEGGVQPNHGQLNITGAQQDHA